MSVIGAVSVPLMAIKAASPPDEPPAPKAELNGLVVTPQRGLDVSNAMPVCGMVVLQWMIAVIAVNLRHVIPSGALTSCLSK